MDEEGAESSLGVTSGERYQSATTDPVTAIRVIFVGNKQPTATTNRVLPLPSRDPTQELRDAINLIVIASAWKGQHLGQEVLKPGGRMRQPDLTSLNLCRFGAHAGDLVSLGLDRDGTHGPALAQVLNEGCAVSGILDQDWAGLVPSS